MSDESIKSVSTFYMDDIPKSPETQNFNIWLQSLNKRSLSLPDIHKMQQEWVKYQNSDESIKTEPTHGAKLQVR